MVTDKLRLALAQINTKVGDINGNAHLIGEYISKAKSAGADLVAFPELSVTGYPPEDLLLKPDFLKANISALEEIAKLTEGITAIVGYVGWDQASYNAAAVLCDGRIVGEHRKHHLPNYGVFDERRYFKPGTDCAVYKIRGCHFGISICEDIWYPDGPHRQQSARGAELILNINASPFHAGKWQYREKLLTTRASDNAAILAYLNLVGGQDELVFDGHSIIIDYNGDILARAPAFRESLLLCDLDLSRVRTKRLADPRWRPGPVLESKIPIIDLAYDKSPFHPSIPDNITEPPSRLGEIYDALVLGTRDYFKKNGFNEAVIGLSGGIDSSLVAAIAADALGPGQVIGVSMPSHITSAESKKDAELLAKNLGIRFFIIPINKVQEAYLSTMKPHFENLQPDATEENLQARTRGNILMSLSNKFGWLVLTTGNKSETACGYCTLYGDMAGGFAVIKDVPKTMVYELAAYRNTISQVIPQNVILKEPSAELRPNQKDTDSLPPYGILDPILNLYIEEDLSVDDIIARGFEADVVKKVAKLVDTNEYKRRQAPPGIKITPKAFGKDRRLPITNGFKTW